MKVSGYELYTAASVGISVNLTPAHGVNELLREADVALYQTKATQPGTFTQYRANSTPTPRSSLNSTQHCITPWTVSNCNY